MVTYVLLLVGVLLLYCALWEFLQVKDVMFRAPRTLRHRWPHRLSFSGFEPLEARMCLAVTFGYDAGVLTVDGDDSPNAISLLQSGDGIVQATGDGQSQTFSDVDQVIVNAGGGDDQIFFHGIVSRFSAGERSSSVQINAGAGSDTIVVDDDGPRGSQAGRVTGIAVDPVDIGVDLGTGADTLTVSLNHHDDVDLDVFSSDGGDGVVIGLLLPAVQRIRAEAPRLCLNIDLATGGNLVDVHTANFDDVNVSLNTSVRTPSTPVLAGDNFTFQFDRQPVAARFVPEGSVTFISDSISLGGTSLAISANGFMENTVALATGGGDDSVTAQFDSRSISPNTRLDLDMNLGAGDDKLSVDTTGIATVAERLSLGEGDDVAMIRHRAFFIVDRTQLSMIGDLGAGNDLLRIDTAGYSTIMTDIDTGPAGDGRDLVLGTHVAHGTNQGWGKWEIGVRPIPRANSQVRLLDTPLDDGEDRAVYITVGFFEVNQIQIGKTRQITLIQDL